MRWHRWILRHKQDIRVLEPVWVHGGQRPKRRLINCSCGQCWVRR